MKQRVLTVVLVPGLWICVAAAQRSHPTPYWITASDGGTLAPYEAPRTEWGVPDIQGLWSSDDAVGVPLERPLGTGTSMYLDDIAYAERRKRIETVRPAGGVNTGQDIWHDVGRRTWRQASLVVDPANGRIPSFTAAALNRRSRGDDGSWRVSDDPSTATEPFETFADFTLNDRCITRGIVGSVLPAPYGNGQRIIQAPGLVVISYEMIHDSRIIYTDGRPHIGAAVRQYLGDSRGRWEDDTLVIDTRNLTDRTSVNQGGRGVRHSQAMVMTERLRRVAADILQYQVTLNDPETYAAPFSISLPLTPVPGGVILPYECHEGNYSLSNTLRGARESGRSVGSTRD